jgi:hypothetical protein
MIMKIFIVFIIAATLLLPAISSRLFANNDNCKTTVCCNAKKKCIAKQKVQAELNQTETNPFTILIPGNHF